MKKSYVIALAVVFGGAFGFLSVEAQQSQIETKGYPEDHRGAGSIRPAYRAQR